MAAKRDVELPKADPAEADDGRGFAGPGLGQRQFHFSQPTSQHHQFLRLVLESREQQLRFGFGNVLGHYFLLVRHAELFQQNSAHQVVVGQFGDREFQEFVRDELWRQFVRGYDYGIRGTELELEHECRQQRLRGGKWIRGQEAHDTQGVEF